MLDMAFSGQLPDESALPTDVASLQPLLLVRMRLVALVALVGVDVVVHIHVYVYFTFFLFS